MLQAEMVLRYINVLLRYIHGYNFRPCPRGLGALKENTLLYSPLVSVFLVRWEVGTDRYIAGLALDLQAVSEVIITAFARFEPQRGVI